jgi:hypothetical protein
MSAGVPIPNLTGGTAGPAVSENDGGSGTAFTGDFNFKPKADQGGIIARNLPLVILGGVVWLMFRNR